MHSLNFLPLNLQVFLCKYSFHLCTPILLWIHMYRGIFSHRGWIKCKGVCIFMCNDLRYIICLNQWTLFSIFWMFSKGTLRCIFIHLHPQSRGSYIPLCTAHTWIRNSLYSIVYILVNSCNIDKENYRIYKFDWYYRDRSARDNKANTEIYKNN